MLVELETFAPKNPQGFIVIEGVNGAGKSTVIASIAEHLEALRHSFVRTHEPGDTALGKELRRLLLNSPDIKRHPTAELLLFGADRSEHVDSVIRPALEQKKIVLCDRYLYSTIAFQGYGRQLDHDLIDRVNQIAIKDTLPDLVILLDIDAAEGLRRTRTRSLDGSVDDTFELETLEFHKRIRHGFLTLASERPEPFLKIDASQPLETVKAQALKGIDLLVKGLPGHAP